MSKQSAAERLLQAVANTTQFPEDIEEAVDHYHAVRGLGNPERDKWDERQGIWRGLSGGERASILIALSLHGVTVPLDLRDAFAVMDHQHVELCLDAMHETAGVD